VVPINDTNLKNNLVKVQTDLENRYKKHRSELRKGFTDLTSEVVHITLFGIHANKARILQVQNALTIYQEIIHKHNINGVFDIEIRGLGSWTTKSGCVCLYADLSKDSAAKVKTLAKEMRDFVNAFILDNLNIENINLNEENKLQLQPIQDSILPIQDKIVHNTERNDENSSDEDDFDIPKNNNRAIHHNENNENPDIIYSEESSSDDEEGENEKESNEDEISGFWIDDPKPDIYIPHLTLLKTDPKWDKKLRVTLNDGRGKSGKRDKTGKRGALKTPKEVKSIEPFGWSFSLYRELRNEYAKISFGIQRVHHIELQTGFKSITNVLLPNSLQGPY